MALLYVTPEVEGAEATVVDAPAAAENPSVAPVAAPADAETSADTPTPTNDGENTDSANNEITEVPGDNNDVAPTAGQQPEAGSPWSFFIMIGAMILIMYFFMWRPEKKRRKQMEQFRQGLKKGDKVITAGGIDGSIKEVHETSVLIECESNTTLRVDKNMVVGDPSQGTAR